MAVQRRVNWISQQRVDVPDVRSIESAASNDFDQLIQAFVTGTSQGYVLRGFEISMTGAIGGAASGLQMVVDPGALMHIGASQSGTIFMVPAGTPNQQLSSAINTAVSGAFTPNAINYVGIDYTRFIDPTTDAQVYIWDPTTNSETTLVAPRAQILEFQIIISTSVWPANVLPIAKVTTDAGNNVVSVTDSRWLLFRLGTGGTNPDPFFSYPWIDGRSENPVTSSSDSIDPFFGGDKQLLDLKDWMNAVMSSLLEIKGTTYWYSLSSAGSIANLREDLGMTVVTGAGSISHGVLPNSIPVLTTTGNTAVGSDQLTALASTTGLLNGQIIFGNGIPQMTAITSIVGSTVTMTHNATETLTGESVAFYSPTTVTAPGQVNWDQGIFLDVIGSNLSYQFLPNPASSDILLADNQVAYVNLVRGQTVSPNLIFTNGSPIVQSVGSIAWTTLLQAGDFVRLVSDTDASYYKTQSVDSLSQVTLAVPYGGTSTGAAGVKAVYAFGSYAHSPTAQISDRYIHIADRGLVPTGGNVWWFLLREDNGSSVATVYVRFIGQELQLGDTNVVGDGFPKQVLQYIGSPSEFIFAPNYTNALIPGSVPQVTDLAFGTSAAGITTVANNQYFYINSAGNVRKYYVWFNVNGAGVDPAPAADRAGIVVNITSGSANSVVATAVANALDATPMGDFSAVTRVSPNQYIVRVTDTSAGTTTLATNGNVAATFTITNIQSGIGVGNAIIHDGDNLTLAIKELDQEFALILANANNPDYDEPLSVISGIPANSNQITGPISPGTDITLPLNSREGETAQVYITGKGALQLFLNGQYLNLNETVTSSIVASNSIGTQTASIGLHNPDTAFAVQVTPGATVAVSQIKFLVTPAGSSPAGNLFANIYSDASGSPGSVLATSVVIAQSSLAPGLQTITFIFSSPFTVTSGTPYWFGITGDSTYLASTQHVQVGTFGTAFTTKDFFNATSWIPTGGSASICFEIDAGSIGGFDWTEVGAANTFSNQIQINRSLVIGDVLTFRIDSGGGSTTGAAGPIGPAGPAGAPGAGPGGSASTSISTVFGPTAYTVLLTDTFRKADCSAGLVTFVLPTAAAAIGRIFYFIKVDASANLMTVQAAGADLINGLSSLSTAIQFDSFSLVSDGTTWSAF